MTKGEDAFILDSGFGGLTFLAGRGSPEGEGKPEADLGGGMVTGFLLEAFGKVAGLFEHEGVVAQGECLQGRGGGEALGGEVGRVWAI